MQQEDIDHPPLRVAFIHPDLGIGGAERLFVDAAVGVQSRGHQVKLYTSHHDPNHCFEETRDGTFSVQVLGDWIPRNLFGKFYIFCAIARQLALTISLLRSNKDEFDIYFVDQLSACIPLLRWFSNGRVLFYCHFPDKLLATRGSLAKSIYRYPFDKFEEWTTGLADTLVVNSEFTGRVFRRSFPSILKKPRVLYPPINFKTYDRPVDMNDPTVQILQSSKHTLVSINRFERKKNVELALRAFAALKTECMVSEETFNNHRLVLAGGYDRRVTENVEYLQELDQLASTFGLKTFTIQPGTLESPPSDTQVVFLCSFNDAQRNYLLSQSLLLLYTPSNEHFGITPVEGMYAKVPVIAVNNGGPLETVKHEDTGLLLPPDPHVWAEGIQKFVQGTLDGPAMGARGRTHVQSKFGLEAFADQLEDILEELMSGGRPTHYRYDNTEYIMRIVMAVVIFIAWYKYWF